MFKSLFAAVYAVSVATVAAAAPPSITIYEHIGFAGKSRTIEAATASLDGIWNDQASSLRITSGSWELCRNNDFADCRVFDADVTDLRAIKNWNDVVSSLRPVAVAAEASASAPSTAPVSAGTASGEAAAFAGQPASVKGYLDYRKDNGLIVEGQRLVVGAKTKFHGTGEARSPTSIPLGYQVEASGVRRPDGGIEVARLDAKPNGDQMFESDIKQATDQLEATWRQSGEMLSPAPDGKVASMGKLHESGPDYDRARRIVDRVMPPYIPPESVRVYVVDNEEWNAMAMGNYSIYVFTGIMNDFDDDELALVLGHEIAHASHEHTRKQQKSSLWTGILATGAAVVAQTTLEDGEAQVAGILTGLGAAALGNGYSREHEDQADRVGMRYAYEGGYDVSKGPQMWKRFAGKYGEASKAQNILFGDHSRASTRAVALDKEIALNYASR